MARYIGLLGSDPLYSASSASVKFRGDAYMSAITGWPNNQILPISRDHPF